MNFKVKAKTMRFWLIILASIAVFSVVAYAAVQDYVLNVPSTWVVVQADPGLQLIALDNTTVVTSITFGNVVQGGTGTWSGYLNNTGNVDLHTFSIGSPDIGSAGAVTWNMPASGDLSVGQMCPVTITLSINQTADLGSHTGTIQIAGSPTISGPTNIVITASDPSDSYSRYWGLMFDGSMPPIVSFEGYVGADVNEVHFSGDTMVAQWTLSAGAHFLIFGITQVSGPSYGTYSGTITINGKTFNFSGLDADHPLTIDFTV